VIGGVPLLAGAPSSPGSGKVLLVGPSTNAAYQETFSEILERLQSRAVETVVLDARGESGVAEFAKAMSAGPRLVVAVGSEAVEWAARGKWQVPVVTSMTLRPPARWATLVSSVVLAVPLATVLMKLKSCFAGRSRLGILINPASGDGRATIVADCSRAGFTPEIAECPTPADLVSRFIALKERKVDFALCFADSSLYNAATIKPLVMASLEQRIPLVGFSAGFVRAGAAVGVYADLKAFGRQTAEAALLYLANRGASEPEPPRSVQVAINQRVARLIGLEYRESEIPEVVIFR
jgi:putative ABC transport system substrate-binding protein